MEYGPHPSERRTLELTTIQVGLPVVDEGGNFIGTVKVVEEDGLLIDRSRLHFADLYLPAWVHLDIGAGQIKLAMNRNEIEQAGQQPPDRNG